MGLLNFVRISVGFCIWVLSSGVECLVKKVANSWQLLEGILSILDRLGKYNSQRNSGEMWLNFISSICLILCPATRGSWWTLLNPRRSFWVICSPLAEVALMGENGAANEAPWAVPFKAISCQILGKLFSLPGPQFSIYKMTIRSDQSTKTETTTVHDAGHKARILGGKTHRQGLAGIQIVLQVPLTPWWVCLGCAVFMFCVHCV